MGNLRIGLVVIAVAIAAEASQQHAQYIAAPRDFQTSSQGHQQQQQQQQQHTKHTSSVKVIHHHHIVPSVVSATALAHQQHAQRVAQEQQDRISKAAFGRGDAAQNQRATVISTHMTHPAEGAAPSPVAYTLIRQRPLHNQHQAPVSKPQQALKTSSSSSALQYHPVMRYTTVIKHPSPGGAPAEYSTIPIGAYQKQFYGSGKFQVAGSVPYAAAGNKQSHAKSYSPIAYDANGVGPLSRPLYSPAAVKKPSHHHSHQHQYYQSSGTTAAQESPNAYSSNPSGSSLYSVSAHTVPEESPFNPSDVEAIEPSVQLPPEALKEILGDNYQDYYSSPAAGQQQQQQSPQYESSSNQELFPQTLNIQEAPRKSIFGTPMKYVPHQHQRPQQHQHQQQQQAVLTTSTRHIEPSYQHSSSVHGGASGPSEPESEGPSSYVPQSGPSYVGQQQQHQEAHVAKQPQLVHSHPSSHQIHQQPQRYTVQQQLLPHPAYAQFAPQVSHHQSPYSQAYAAYAPAGHPGSHPSSHAVIASPQHSQVRPQVAPSYSVQQPSYFTQMTGHHAPPQYIAYQQISNLPGRAAAAVQAEVSNNGVDSLKPDIDSVYSLPF